MISGEIGIGETCWPEKGEEDMSADVASGLREVVVVRTSNIIVIM